MNSLLDITEKAKFELRYLIPDALLDKQLEYSLSQFCRDSSALREFITISSFANDQVVTSANANVVISSVRSVRAEGRLLSKSLYGFNEVYAQLYIDPSVGAIGQEVEVEAIMVPEPGYTDYPPSFYAAYGEGVVAHACFELSIDASEPWARVPRMPLFKQKYDQVVSQARRRNFKPFSMRA